MAIETVTVDSGTGLDVAVDTGTEGAVQLVKLALSADGSTGLIAADAGGLLVNLGANNDVTVSGTVTASGPLTDAELRATPVPVSGTVTANAGTNLNTSLLALEDGGNLAAVAASASVLDDWDESDRAKVNPIVGQAGVQGASGAVSASTQRVVLATDVALPAGTNAIGKLSANSGIDIGDVDVTSVPTDPFGANADAASATTSISAKLKGIATALGVTALDLGSGTGGSRTLRTFQDTAQFVGGTGTDTSAVQRVSLATNVALPAGANAIGKLAANSGVDIGDVDVTSLPALPTGTNNIGDVDVLTVPADPFGANADAAVAAGATGSIQAKLRRATQGLEDLKSLIVLAAGSNAIGKLAANSGVDIGDVDVTTCGTITPGTAATNLGKAEDAGHTTGDVGVMALSVRNDADASFGADLDYTPNSCDAGGNQNVRPRPALSMFNAQSAGLTTSATAYTAGDQVGSQFTITGAARATGGGGYITGVTLMDEADIIGAYDIVIFDSSVSLASDNAAFAVSDADAAKFVYLINLAAAYDIGNNRIAQASNLRIPYVCSGGTSLYGGLICRAGHTFFALVTNLRLKVFLEPS